MIWLPDDLFEWTNLRFRQDILRYTAFISNQYYNRLTNQAGLQRDERTNDFITRTIRVARQNEDPQSVFYPLHQLVLFQLCHELLY